MGITSKFDTNVVATALGRWVERRLYLAAAIAAVLVVCANGWGGALAQDKTKVEFAVANRSVSSLALMVAKGKGYFDAEGLDVNLNFFTGGPPATAALLGGSAEYLSAALEDTLKAIKQGQPIVVLSTLLGEYTGAIVMRKDFVEKLGRKPTVQDLKGLRIGTLARGGFTDVSTRYVLQLNGIDPEKDATLIPVRGGDRQLAAGNAGELDANALVDPWPYIAVEKLDEWRYVVNFTTGEGPELFRGLGFIMLQSTKANIEKNRPTAEKVVRAVVRAQNFIADLKNLDEVVKIALDELKGTDVDALKVSIQRGLKGFNPYVPASMVTKNMELLLKNGLIEGAAPPYASVVDTSFAPLWKAYKQ